MIYAERKKEDKSNLIWVDPTAQQAESKKYKSEMSIHFNLLTAKSAKQAEDLLKNIEGNIYVICSNKTIRECSQQFFSKDKVYCVGIFCSNQNIGNQNKKNCGKKVKIADSFLNNILDTFLNEEKTRKQISSIDKFDSVQMFRASSLIASVFEQAGQNEQAEHFYEVAKKKQATLKTPEDLKKLKKVKENLKKLQDM